MQQLLFHYCIYIWHVIGTKVNSFLYKRRITAKEPLYIYFGGKILSSTEKENCIIGSNFSLRGTIRIAPLAYFKVGESTSIWHHSVIEAWCKVEIGSYCMIGPDVWIQDTNSHSIFAQDRYIEIIRSKQIHRKDILTRYPPINEIRKPIKIGDHVWIGGGSRILKGVTIGDRAIIATGAIVSKDVPPDTIVAGNPARVVKVIKNNFIDKRKAFKALGIKN